jgi:hypothetical protein
MDKRGIKKAKSPTIDLNWLTKELQSVSCLGPASEFLQSSGTAGRDGRDPARHLQRRQDSIGTERHRSDAARLSGSYDAMICLVEEMFCALCHHGRPKARFERPPILTRPAGRVVERKLFISNLLALAPTGFLMRKPTISDWACERYCTCRLCVRCRRLA